MICLCSKTYCCFGKSTEIIKFKSKGLNKRTPEEYGAGPLEKYTCVLDERTNVQSTNRGFRTIQHSICTYEQTKRVYHTFILKELISMMAFTRNRFFCKGNDRIIIILVFHVFHKYFFIQIFYIAFSG